MKELDEIYQLLKEKDPIVAEKYKAGVFNHIDRIRVKAGIGELVEIPEVEDTEDEVVSDDEGIIIGMSFEQTSSSRDVNLIKSAIKNLVDYLS